MFSSFGNVEAVETIRTKGRSFAYLDFLPSPTDDKSLSRLFSKYNGCVWKGGKLKLEKAKEHYLVRLKREWDEDAMSKIEHVSDKPVTTDKLEEKPTKESLKTKQLHIYFPRLRKVKSIPFTGTGKHKYSFQNIKVPLLPVHFCDCKEHCSPSGTERGKLHIERATEIGGMNDEEINIMNVVMNKLLGKENLTRRFYLQIIEKNRNNWQKIGKPFKPNVFSPPGFAGIMSVVLLVIAICFSSAFYVNRISPHCVDVAICKSSYL
ncbi:hypothetical protein AHAS_Ahas15G0346600 [Arachis hypogaea]